MRLVGGEVLHQENKNSRRIMSLALSVTKINWWCCAFIIMKGLSKDTVNQKKQWSICSFTLFSCVCTIETDAFLKAQKHHLYMWFGNTALVNWSMYNKKKLYWASYRLIKRYQEICFLGNSLMFPCFLLLCLINCNFNPFYFFPECRTAAGLQRYVSVCPAEI